MPDDYKLYRAFVASPGDVQAERKAVEQVCASVNRTVRDALHVIVDPRKWEHQPPETPHIPEEQIQDVINREVERAHFFILVLWKRYGSVEPGQILSNTEREINTILARYEKHPNLKILSYFRDIGQNADPGDQEVKVRDLRTRLERLGVRYRTYQSEEEFAALLTHDLYDAVLRMKVATFKQQALRTFWQFGDTGRPHQRVAVLFPPLSRESLADGKRTAFWFSRLNPPIAAEDYKALQKIEKHFRMIELPDYRVYPNSNAPAELPTMNAVWLCLPGIGWASHSCVITCDGVLTCKRRLGRDRSGSSGAVDPQARRSR